ncbi:hypothetical protein ABEB22_12615 [Thioclava sp. 'Guangxiensis']|uniref:hypothetical protein n=1 Tax=Thioclava sp. 'Guangxiensis' TaxID=3149044 RepID=UPI0038779F45
MSYDQKDLERGLLSVEKEQVPYATMLALNETASDVLKHVQDRMDVVFDRPTKFTKNAFQVWRATKSNLSAAVQERPSVGSRHYLKRQETGGARGQTGVEKLLAGRLAYDGLIAAVLPASGAKLDSYGNWSRGERNQVLSQLMAQRDSRSNQTDRSRKRKGSKRASYFVPKNGGLSPGVWRRDRSGEIAPVLTFVDAMPHYDKRLGFYDGAQEVFDARFAENFRVAFAKAMATRR